MSWLTGWTYRKSHVINAATGAGTNYQVKIIVHYGDEDDNGNNVYCDGKCQGDFGDIRFTSSDGGTELSYWRESKTDYGNAVFWVKVAGDLDSNQTIFVYYGKDDATTASNGEDTFLKFDDFNDGSLGGIWSLHGTGTITESGGIVDVNTTSTWGHKCIGLSMNDDNTRIRIKLYAHDSAGQLPELIYGDWTTTNWIIFRDADAKIKMHTLQSGVSGLRWTSTNNYSTGTWYIAEVLALGTSIKLTLLDSSDSEIENSGFINCDNNDRNLWIGSGQSGSAHFDDFFICKYVNPEPTHGSWGTEENTKWQTVYSNLEVRENLAAQGTIQGAEYKSSDGTNGATADVTISETTLHFKNGLFVG